MMNLGIKEHLTWFNANDYAAHLHAMTAEELQKEEHSLRCNRTGAQTGAVATAALSLHTAFTSLVGTAIDLRSIQLDDAKLKLIYEEMTARNVPPLKYTTRDFLSSMTRHLVVTAAVGGVGMGLDQAMMPAVTSAVEEAAVGVLEETVSSVAEEAVLQADEEHLERHLAPPGRAGQTHTPGHAANVIDGHHYEAQRVSPDGHIQVSYRPYRPHQNRNYSETPGSS